MYGMAIVLYRQGRYIEAEAMHRHRLQFAEKLLGQEDSETLCNMNGLASVLHSQSKYIEAEGIQRQVVKGYEKLRGKEHPFTLTSVDNLAMVLKMPGQVRRRCKDTSTNAAT